MSHGIEKQREATKAAKALLESLEARGLTAARLAGSTWNAMGGNVTGLAELAIVIPGGCYRGTVSVKVGTETVAWNVVGGERSKVYARGELTRGQVADAVVAMVRRHAGPVAA